VPIIDYAPASKVGWQTKNRFWETDDGIYGGISWTKHPIKQIWYPSDRYGSETGVLTGAYNEGDTAYQFGNQPLEKRFALALEGGEKLHPGNYRDNVMLDTALSVAWHQMPYFSGGWPADLFAQRPTSFRRLVELNPEGRIYLAGDFFSYWPGWQEGAVAAANWVFGEIRDRVRAE
jgi:monoamine oxidase